MPKNQMDTLNALGDASAAAGGGGRTSKSLITEYYIFLASGVDKYQCEFPYITARKCEQVDDISPEIVEDTTIKFMEKNVKSELGYPIPLKLECTREVVGKQRVEKFKRYWERHGHNYSVERAIPLLGLIDGKWGLKGTRKPFRNTLISQRPIESKPTVSKEVARDTKTKELRLSSKQERERKLRARRKLKPYEPLIDMDSEVDDYGDCRYIPVDEKATVEKYPYYRDMFNLTDGVKRHHSGKVQYPLSRLHIRHRYTLDSKVKVSYCVYWDGEYMRTDKYAVYWPCPGEKEQHLKDVEEYFKNIGE